MPTVAHPGTGAPSDKKQYPHADSPLELRKRDWIEIAKRVYQEVVDDNIGMVAAASAYYALFSIFPLLIATVSIYGFVSDPIALEKQINELSQFIPVDAAKVLSDQLRAIIDNPSAALGWSALFSILIALWTASAGTKAIIEGLNIAYDETEKRGFFKLQLHAVMLTFGAVLAIILAVGLIIVLPVVMNFVGMGSFANTVMLVIRWPFLALLFILGIAVTNRWAPSRKQPKWRWLSVGSVLGTVLILSASAGLAFYVKRFGTYNATYGSLSGVIILLLWFYLVSYAVLLSAEVNAEIEHQTVVDSTVGPAKPMGRRGAIKADTLPS